MKWRVKNKKNINLLREGELLLQCLEDRGVENPKHYLELTDDDILNGQLLGNVDMGLACFDYHMKQQSKIHIIYDVDVDGVCSGAIMYNYIKRLNPNQEVTFHMNASKKHGIIYSELKEFLEDGMLLIAPDCGTTDCQQANIILNNYDVDILVIDHHEAGEKELISSCSDNIVLINNQLDEYPNKTLCGGALVWKFLQEYDKLIKAHYSDNLVDLAMIALVGDQMDLRNEESRRIVDKGLSNIKHPFVKDIIISRVYKADSWEQVTEEDLTIKNIAFWVCPLINGAIRAGTKEERVELIEAMNNKEQMVEYQGRRTKGVLPPPVLETWSKHVVRLCTSIKGKQDRLTKKYMTNIESSISDEYLESNKVVLIDSSQFEDKIERELTGLLANKIASANRIRRPVLFLTDIDENTFGGSARCYNMFERQELKDDLELSGLGNGSGHQGAFGIKIPKENIESLQEYFNELYQDVNIEDVYNVDYAINLTRLKEQDIINIGKYARVFGVGVLSKPTFVIENVNVKVEDIQLKGEKKTMLVINKTIGDKTFKFIKSSSEEEYNKIIGKEKGVLGGLSKSVTFDFICEFECNHYNNKSYGQIRVIDYNAKQEKGNKPIRRRFSLGVDK